jgi:hypothetical protein
MSRFELGSPECQELELLAKGSHDAIAVGRAHALLALHEGLSAREIAELLDVSRQTI